MPDIFTRNNTMTSGHAHIFSAFCENPYEVSFKDQEENEKILLILRRHFITNVSWIFITFILLILPAGFAILNSNFSIINLANFSTSFVVLLILFYYLSVSTYSFVNFITWYFNISIVTQKRIIDIDFSNLVYKNIAATKLAQVEDVSYTQAGVIRTLFDYGDVLVQTAGEFENFDFTAVPHPERVIKIIEDLIGKGPNA